MKPNHRRPGRIGGISRALRIEWHDIGGLGRMALLGVGASIFVAVALGFSITRSAEQQILDAQTDLLVNAARDLAGRMPSDAGVLALDPEFDQDVRTRLLGGETVGVKLWLPDGTVVYSDDDDALGRRFDLSEHATRAFQGTPLGVVVDTADPAHARHRELGSVIEFFIPFGEPNAPTAVFEIEQRVDGLHAAVGQIGRNVWLSISTGLVVLGIFLSTLLAARTRSVDRRRRQAERMFGDLLRAQDEERRRVVGALHDDIGQPLYRLHYGLEGSISKLEAGHPVKEELLRLQHVVAEADDTLRAELRLLHDGLMADAGLVVALEDLAESTRHETDIRVRLDVDGEVGLAEVPRTALYRAIREGITNARKHSGAATIDVRVHSVNGHVRAEIEDDGRGNLAAPGLGLTTTRERLEAIGGGLATTRSHRGGTLLTVWVPSQDETA